MIARMPRMSSSFRSVVREYGKGHVTPGHDHDWPQLLYASSGVMAVETEQGSWTVPPQRAIWLPRRAWHAVRMLTDVKLASLYLRQTGSRPLACEVMEIRPLLRELLIAVIDIDFLGELTRHESLLADLIAEELAAAKRGGSPVPLPADARLLPFCRRVLKDPSLHIPLDQHAREGGLTTKTVSRLFQRELGMSFREWRQLVQSTYAVAHLVQGDPVKVIASRLGFTPSAFSVMMQRNLRRTPTSFKGRQRVRGIGKTTAGFVPVQS